MEWERRQFRERRQRGGIGEGGTTEDPPSTGEERLLSRLRRVNKKDLNIAEVYCARNILTMGQYPKTKHHMILERYLGHEENEDRSNVAGGGRWPQGC
jgi:hypothetical protein